ncbi:MAG: carbon storage regulator CsrA [Firmicutes bacterium]|nr:carbon storage regulator CsrA [Bacillota bacterium]
MLVLTRKLNESIMVGDNVKITIVDVKGDQVKLGITAPREVVVHREEVYREIQKENQLAANAKANLDQLSKMFEKK